MIKYLYIYIKKKEKLQLVIHFNNLRIINIACMIPTMVKLLI